MDEPPTFSSTSDLTSGRHVAETHDPAPQYQGDDSQGNDMWLQWEIVDNANKAVKESRALLAELEPKLKAKTEQGTKLKEHSSKLFAIAHRKKPNRVMAPLRRLSSNSSSTAEHIAARKEFEVAHKEETTLMVEIEDLNAKVESLKDNIRSNAGLASTVDQVFELLSASVAATFPHNYAHTAEEAQLAVASENYQRMHKLVADLTRACVTVQHAHHYYTTVLKTIDSMRGMGFVGVIIGGLGEVSKQRDYKVAMNTATKAQVCFNETVRVLSPHATMLPVNILEDFESLQKLGLLQASSLYGLMYGWQSKSTGVRKAVEVILQKQEDVFAKLTRFAVWVQDKVPVCEAELRAVQENRDKIRRELVRSWSGHRMLF